MSTRFHLNELMSRWSGGWIGGRLVALTFKDLDELLIRELIGIRAERLLTALPNERDELVLRVCV